MLTKRQNMLEVIRGGNPDRFVKQYEGLTFVLNTPYQTKYPMMPEGPGAPTVKCGWGYYNSGRRRVEKICKGTGHQLHGRGLERMPGDSCRN